MTGGQFRAVGPLFSGVGCTVTVWPSCWSWWRALGAVFRWSGDVVPVWAGISNRPLDTAVAGSQHTTLPIPNRVEILLQPR